MPPFKRERSSDRKSSSGFSDRRSSASPGLHKAVCGTCGATCDVPFKPRSDRPVFCSRCFKRPDASSSRFGRPDSRPDSRQDARSSRRPEPSFSQDGGNQTKQLDVIEKKLDQILSILSDLVEEE